MNEQNHQPDLDVLEQAVRAVRAAPIPELPESLQTATVAALASRATLVEPAAPPPVLIRRSPMTRYLKYGSALAASVLFSTLAAVLWLGPGQASAWQEVLEQVSKARSVTYDEIEVNELQPNLPIRKHYQVQGDCSRADYLAVPDTFSVINYKTGEILQVNGSLRTFQRHTPKSGQLRQQPDTLTQRIAKLKKQPHELAGEEQINGKPAQRVILRNANLAGNTGVMVLWFDPATKLPVKIYFEVESTFPKITKSMENFQWNVNINPASFAPEVPAGFENKLDVEKLRELQNPK